MHMNQVAFFLISAPYGYSTQKLKIESQIWPNFEQVNESGVLSGT